MRNPVPVIALFLCSLTTAAQGVNGFEILFKSGTILPERNITDSNLAIYNRSTAKSAGKAFLVLQFDNVLTETEKQVLFQKGIQVHD